ncbi:hypothetical protein CLIB1423_07S03774 [[Candida] railenensis]|uniref:SnoaL-like domain-containing protein n=1 Tax=[Candida] railenensis TaxID=45579 RepID=A0A9P0QPS6_9ASCO|nr:hypothetical protein CLIB1423_07S03774 [[Candida] railenensis]
MFKAVEQLYERMNAGDLSNFVPLFTENFSSQRVGFPKRIGRKQWMEESFIPFLTSCPNIKFEILKTINGESETWVWSKISGLPGDQSKMSVDIYRIEDGKIAEHWDIQQDIAKE